MLFWVFGCLGVTQHRKLYVHMQHVMTAAKHVDPSTHSSAPGDAPLVRTTSSEQMLNARLAATYRTGSSGAPSPLAPMNTLAPVEQILTGF
jgi:hypothetical protein